MASKGNTRTNKTGKKINNGSHMFDEVVFPDRLLVLISVYFRSFTLGRRHC